MDKEQEAFNNSRCGNLSGVHKDGAVIAWKARAALDMSEELAAALEACLKKGSKWHPCSDEVMRGNAALNKYRERKI